MNSRKHAPLASAIAILLAGCGACAAQPAHAATPPTCQKIVLTGEARAGQEWKAGIGEGWVFRLLAIDSTKPGNAAYTGWDLVVDREQPAGFPDALLVATPPFNSINEREVGTTFGLRSQDAIGWNPRFFRFLTSPAAFAESQKIYLGLSQNGHLQGAGGAAATGDSGAQQIRRLMELGRQASAGQFRIMDARLAPGISDAQPYAENWAMGLPRTPHQFEAGAAGKPSALGELHWIRFSITLWLPATWIAPREIHAVRTGCSE